ncbi:hypothetical protein RBWH47_01734 [Rhodopirellula baltica WH47]|uniref:Uncharacterized protein n=1 Tax=Rhodopirellula baltica WH47 TaxID=991778 RepID=F2AV80_RHOBT|nr:hypothetical protein RBWH47_01734 [Rhodopirellula baltica WH47]
MNSREGFEQSETSYDNRNRRLFPRRWSGRAMHVTPAFDLIKHSVHQ